MSTTDWPYQLTTANTAVAWVERSFGTGAAWKVAELIKDVEGSLTHIEETHVAAELADDPDSPTVGRLLAGGVYRDELDRVYFIADTIGESS